MSMRAIAIFSGDDEPRPLGDIVERIEAPVLLIASNRAHEADLDAIYRDRIGPHARLWHVTDAGHTHGYSVHPAEYRRRALEFFAAALS